MDKNQRVAFARWQEEKRKEKKKKFYERSERKKDGLNDKSNNTNGVYCMLNSI